MLKENGRGGNKRCNRVQTVSTTTVTKKGMNLGGLGREGRSERPNCEDF